MCRQYVVDLVRNVGMLEGRARRVITTGPRRSRSGRTGPGALGHPQGPPGQPHRRQPTTGRGKANLLVWVNPPVGLVSTRGQQSRPRLDSTICTSREDCSGLLVAHHCLRLPTTEVVDESQRRWAVQSCRSRRRIR